MTQSKNFLSVIKDKINPISQNHDKNVPIIIETIYKIELIDTSSEEMDIDISEVLIKEGRAIKKEVVSLNC